LRIKTLCELAGVSRSGYYAFQNQASQLTEKEKLDQEDFKNILAAYQFKNRHKGARSIKMTLYRQYGITMNLKKIRRLMKKFGLMCPIRKPNPYKRMAKAMKTSNVANNILNRNFLAGPGKVVLSDITYLYYGKHGDKLAYLSSTKDPTTRQVPAYKVSESLALPFVIDTIHLIKNNKAYTLDKETLIHTDQGCHYTSNEFRALLANEGFVQSMSRRGNCWDNAPQESFFGHMKDELHLANCETFEELSREIDSYMDYYNNYRYQWELSMMSPNEYAHFLKDGSLPSNLGARPQTPGGD